MSVKVITAEIFFLGAGLAGLFLPIPKPYSTICIGVGFGVNGISLAALAVYSVRQCRRKPPGGPQHDESVPQPQPLVAPDPVVKTGVDASEPIVAVHPIPGGPVESPTRRVVIKSQGQEQEVEIDADSTINDLKNYWWKVIQGQGKALRPELKVMINSALCTDDMKVKEITADLWFNVYITRADSDKLASQPSGNVQPPAQDLKPQ